MSAAEHPFEPTLEYLRARSGNKWSRFDSDVLPAWVADMDFAPAPMVSAALEGAIRRGDLGYYGDRLVEVANCFAQWQLDHHRFEVSPDDTVVTDDVIGALRVCLAAFTRPGTSALVPVPIYPPFLDAVADSDALLAPVSLRFDEADWRLDLDAIAAAAPGASTLLLCNPHNPTGAVFGRTDLECLGEIACENDLVVISDEVWADLVYPGAEHVPMGSIDGAVAARTVTLTSASKTFNLGGLRCAVAHFGTADLKERFRTAERGVLGTSNGLGVAATIAAWSGGDSWRRELLAVLEVNRSVVDGALATVEGLRWHTPAATYLTWIDCSSLDLGCPAASYLLDRGRVALSAGEDFASGTEGWVRLNFATGAGVLEPVLDRVTAALTS